jgi:hypothetical protein
MALVQSRKGVLMIASIHQPDYIPYIPYFIKLALSDIFVFLDDAQYSNSKMHQWNRIKTPQGECRLKIPVEKSFGFAINQVRTRDELNWKENHLKTLHLNYVRAPFFERVYEPFQEILLKPYDSLADLNIAINTWITRGFGLQTRIIRASDLKIESRSEDRILDICNLVGADVYISGNGARKYQVEEHFTARNIQLKYVNNSPFVYNQLWNEFIPNLSVLDFLFNHGFDWNFILDKVGNPVI